MSGSNFSPLTAQDGTHLVVVDWPLSKGPVRGVVLIVHGLGEHAWRYDHVAERLNSWGFAVRAYDQFGHGESMGQRGALPSEDRLLSDLAEVVDESRFRMSASTPTLPPPVVMLLNGLVVSLQGEPSLLMAIVAVFE